MGLAHPCVFCKGGYRPWTDEGVRCSTDEKTGGDARPYIIHAEFMQVHWLAGESLP